MTKLMEWLSVCGALFAIWISIVTGAVSSCCLDKWRPLIVPAPLIAIILFAIYAAGVVLYRTFTFNDCEDAAKELQSQIVEAKEDLKKKGFVFS